MVYATTDGSTGARLRVGMVGGGRNAFIGAVHRLAMRLDDRIALVAGASLPIRRTRRLPRPKSVSLPIGGMPTGARWRAPKHRVLTALRRS